MPQYVDYINSTGKSFSEALSLALTIWQKIVHGITMKTTRAERGQKMFCPCTALLVFKVIP